MLQNFKMHIGALTRFSGRETRAMFWPWVGIVMVLNLLITLATGSFSITIQSDNPESMSEISSFFAIIWIGALIAIVLLAAAVVRRLHDSGRSGLLGILPLPFLGFGFYLMDNLFGRLRFEEEPDMNQFKLLFANNILYLALLALLAYLLARKSSVGDNSFGPPPVS